MKFNLNTDLQARVDDEIQVGDVYPAKGGRTGAVYWIVIGVSGDWKSVKVLGIDKEGEIVSATGYNAHSLKERPRVGYAKGLYDLEFDIEPM